MHFHLGQNTNSTLKCDNERMDKQKQIFIAPFCRPRAETGKWGGGGGGGQGGQGGGECVKYFKYFRHSLKCTCRLFLVLRYMLYLNPQHE